MQLDCSLRVCVVVQVYGLQLLGLRLPVEVNYLGEHVLHFNLRPAVPGLRNLVNDDLRVFFDLFDLVLGRRWLRCCLIGRWGSVCRGSLC